MRKFLLILLNVLCLAGMNAQTRVIVSGRSYNQKNATDTITLDYEIKYFTDSKTCLDTAYRVVFHDYYADFTTKVIENGKLKGLTRRLFPCTKKLGVSAFCKAS